jgi:ADP-heptose:LPS heptosyltransferase
MSLKTDTGLWGVGRKMLRALSRRLRLEGHRLALWWSYTGNCFSLRHRLANLPLHAAKRRRVVAISQVVHLGDIVACEPVARYIRRLEPEAFIVWAVEQRYRELVDNHPDINYILALKCATEWIWFANSGLFDQIIDLNISGRCCPICSIPWIPKNGTHGINYDNYFGQNSLLSAYMRSAGLPPIDEPPNLYLDNKVQDAVDDLKLPKEFIAMHCGSNEKSKTLSSAAWLQIKHHINQKHKLPVVELGLAASLMDGGTIGYRNLCGQLSILESAEVIRRSLMYIGTDSGPAHLANAVGAYAIIALGHYHVFKKYTPYSGNYGKETNCELMRHDGPVAEMPVECILAAIDRRMADLQRTH